MKLGKQPARHDARTLHYATYRDPTTNVTVPSTFGHQAAVHDYGMLGNDQYGDCVLAGACHEHMIWTAEHGKPVLFSTFDALSAYEAITGFKPGVPSSDRGTVVLDALNYRRHTGILDTASHRHKIGAFTAIEPGNIQHLLEAAYLFGAVGIGIQFPDSAMDQFNAGKPWSVAPGATIEGGHYVPVVGATGTHLLCVTWGRVQAMTHHFAAKYTDEAYALLSAEHLAGGRTIEGFDLAQLTADLAALTKP